MCVLYTDFGRGADVLTCSQLERSRRWFCQIMINGSRGSSNPVSPGPKPPTSTVILTLKWEAPCGFSALPPTIHARPWRQLAPDPLPQKARTAFNQVRILIPHLAAISTLAWPRTSIVLHASRLHHQPTQRRRFECESVVVCSHA